MEVAGRQIRRVDALALAVDVADRAQRLHFTGAEVDAVDAFGVVVGREPDRAAGDVAALHLVDEARHLDRLEHTPVVVDVVPQELAATEHVHRVRHVRLGVDGHEGIVVLGDVDAVDDGERLRVVAQHRLHAQVVVRLLERCVQHVARDVDVTDVVEAAGRPLGRDGGRRDDGLRERVVGTEQPVVQ